MGYGKGENVRERRHRKVFKGNFFISFKLKLWGKRERESELKHTIREKRDNKGKRAN